MCVTKMYVSHAYKGWFLFVTPNLANVWDFNTQDPYLSNSWSYEIWDF